MLSLTENNFYKNNAMKRIIGFLRKKHIKKETISNYLQRGGTFTITFADNGYRIETRKTQEGVSDLSLFANDECIFKGKYGELVKIITNVNKVK